MLKVYLIDVDAEATAVLQAEVLRLLSGDYWEAPATPDLICQPMPADALKGCGAPVLCIVGPQLLAQSDEQLETIREAFPRAAIMARTAPPLEYLGAIERLALCGVYDILPSDATPQDFLEKLILINRRLLPRSVSGLVCQ